MLTSSVPAPTLWPAIVVTVTASPIGSSSELMVMVACVPCSVRSVTVPVAFTDAPLTFTLSPRDSPAALGTSSTSTRMRPSVEMIASAPSRRKTASASSPAAA